VSKKLDIGSCSTPREIYAHLKEYFEFDNYELLLFGMSDREPYIPGDLVFQNESNELYIVNPYLGSPLLLNEHFLSGNEINVVYVPTISLDSNIASLLSGLVFRPERLNVKDKELALMLLQFFNELKCDFQPIPYYLESAYKNESIVFEKYATQTAEAIFRLQSCDLEAYLQTGTFTSKPGADDYYFKKSGSSSYLGVAQAYVRVQDFQEFVRNQEAVIVLISIALKKMLLIEITSKRLTPIDKLRALHDYFTATLNTVLARELMYASLFFNRQARQLIRVGESDSFETINSRIHSAVWDLFQLRLPELLLAEGKQDDTSLLYPCSADKGVAKVGAIIKLFAIARDHDNFANMRPLLRFNEPVLIRYLGVEQAVEVMQLIHAKQVERYSSDKKWKGQKPTIEFLRQEDVRLNGLLKMACKKT
jgi:hypothetical protein